ncbi:MAG: right-handed parallel beta-helix repeat-containing protein [Thermoguttaceae bacterium]|jgi:hypothetical protein
MRFARRVLLPAIILAAWTCGGQRRAGAEDEWARKMAAARPGITVTLPAGTLRLGGLELPPGVSLRGAGYNKTLLDARDHDVGLICRGTGLATISDLAVAGARQTGILLDGASKVTIERVAVRQCMNGLILRNADGCRLQNLLVTNNRVAAVLSQSHRSSLVNATLADNSAVGLILIGNQGLALFNNLICGSQLGVNYDAGNRNIALDHNLYVCHFVGRMPGQVIRKKVESWRDLSLCDRHSLMMPVEFAGPGQADYRPVSRMSWAPARATTSGWGVREMAGVQAPGQDIDGKPRQARADLGAYETAFTPPRPADGALTVQSGAGVTSAGLYTPGGVCVRSLFQNLPLPKGTHSYWLPSRDWQGRPIPAGDYVLKVTEADLRLEYQAAAGNGDLESSLRLPNEVRMRASVSPMTMAFDPDDRLVLAQHGFENGQHVRGYDADMRNVRWSLPGGGEATGMAADGRGRVYVLRKPASLIRLDAETGRGVTFAGGSFEKSYPGAFTEISGMAALGDRIYVADVKANKLLRLAGEELGVDGSWPLAAPTQLAADTANKLLWVISQGKELLALDASGQVRCRAQPVADPRLLAVGAGRLAVYSPTANKVTVFDCTAPGRLKLLRTLGSGGEGYGKIEPEKFWSPQWLAMNGQNDLAVADPPRVLLFSAAGAVKRQHLAMWGQGISWGWFAADDRTQFFNIGGGYNISLDAKNRRWEPGSRWKYMMPNLAPLCFFTAGGRNFGLFGHNKRDMVVCRLDADGTVRALVAYGYNDKGLFEQRDAHGSGNIDDAAPTTPVLDKNGKPITERLFEPRALSGVDPRRDGAMVIPLRRGVVVVPFKGLDGRNVPQFDFAHRRVLLGLVEGQPKYVSPYDFKTEEVVSIAEDMSMHEDGSFTAAITTKSGAGPDLCTEHANATSMAGFDPQGGLRWLYALNPPGLKMGFYGITTIGGVTFAGRGAICEYETMDRDGLGTGTLGMPPEFGWSGMWLDNHRQTHGFTGNDGQPYLVIGDYCCQAYHWLALKGHDRIVRQSLPVRIGTQTAVALAREPARAVPAWPVPPPPRVVIRRLAQPLPVDGDPEKWRKLGIAPIIMTPDTGGGRDPADNSAIIRLAYHGDRLYVHAIKFDDVVTMHQPLAKFFTHDCLEMCINTYPSGFKYNVTRTSDHGEVVWRDTWRAGWAPQLKLNQLLPPEVAPRVIKVLDNAKNIEDRKLIEAAYGIDMSGCKVILFEFVIPRSAMQPMESKDMEVEFASGKTFRLGFMLDDNDLPGSESWQNITWPVTFGIFERSEKSAEAVFE